MNIRTTDGIDIHCLPENARCKIACMNPEKMHECPICNFDDYGDECVPELCDEYYERD